MVTYWLALAQIGSLFSLGNMLMLIRVIIYLTQIISSITLRV